MKRVLMIAFHFPPFAASSGIQRTLRFVQQLPVFDWQPIVLSAHPRAYSHVSNDLLSEIAPDVIVRRAFALDTARHLSIGGRFLGALARPDRWMTWKFGGVAAGLRLVREWRPQIIWSTFPIATAHAIGHEIHRKTGLPWVADFRDPMAQDGYPADPRVWRSFKQIEECALRNASMSVFTTPGAARMYRERYRNLADRITVIENGFDEESFSSATAKAGPREPLVPGALTLLHSGVVYPSERDPTHLFAAIQKLAVAGTLTPHQLRLRFRAPMHENTIRTLAKEYEVEAFIDILPPVSYRIALEEMLRADALLVLQSPNCNEQIPAKLYEYLRAGRPILGVTDLKGDSAGLLRQAGIDTIAQFDSVDDIAAKLAEFVVAVAHGRGPFPAEDYVAGCSRSCRTESLARLFNQVSTASHDVQ